MRYLANNNEQRIAHVAAKVLEKHEMPKRRFRTNDLFAPISFGGGGGGGGSNRIRAVGAARGVLNDIPKITNQTLIHNWKSYTEIKTPIQPFTSTETPIQDIQAKIGTVAKIQLGCPTPFGRPYLKERIE